MEATRDIHRHMLKQMVEKEQQKKDQELMEEQLLEQKMIQDQKVCLAHPLITRHY